jgi:hypothetical protein
MARNKDRESENKGLHELHKISSPSNIQIFIWKFPLIFYKIVTALGAN